jgi:hypothetical protein
MQRFFELMAHDHVVEVCFLNEVVSLASVKVIDPSRPIHLTLWPRTRGLSAKVLVIGADRHRANALRRADIEGRWTGDEQGLTYVGYSEGTPCIKIVLNSETDLIEFSFL